MSSCLSCLQPYSNKDNMVTSISILKISVYFASKLHLVVNTSGAVLASVEFGAEDCRANVVILKTKLQNRQKEVHNYISQVVISMCNIYAQMCAARYN